MTDTVNGSRAQELAMKHARVEDAQDDEAAAAEGGPSWGPTVSTKSAGKQPASAAPPRAPLDTQSHELFPELGSGKAKTAAPTWGPGSSAAKVNGSSSSSSSPSSQTNGNGGGASRPAAPSPAAPSGGQRGPPSMYIPGRNVETIFLEPQHLMDRSQLKRPLPDIIKDMNRRSRAQISMSTQAGGKLKFDATGPTDVAQQALKDLVQQIGTKTVIKVSIPYSARAHIIGRGGATIKALQEKTGAKIQLPKVEEGPVEDDDEAVIDVTVEGNAHSAAQARNEILRIAGERSANVQTKIRGIPAEFFPFIAGPRNCNVSTFEERDGVQIRVPPHQAFPAQGPPRLMPDGSRPAFSPASNDNCIQMAGDRAAIQKVRAEIDRLAEELHKTLDLQEQAIPHGRHQFIIGKRGISAEDFFAETGCAIILPTEEDDSVTILGPEDKVAEAVLKAGSLAMDVQSMNLDVSRLHQNAPGGAAVHGRNVTRYLKSRREIERLESQHKVFINTPLSIEGGALPWEFYTREFKGGLQAQNEIKNIFQSHPPNRIGSVPIDSFFHQHLRSDISPRVRQDFGVHLVVPEASEGDLPVLLVYEGPSAPSTYQVPTTRPSADEARAFQQSIADARKHILDLINKQEKIDTRTVDVPQKFHDRLRRFIKKEKESRSADEIPVRVSSVGTSVTMRGPASAVESLLAKVNAFVEQEKQDEKERDHTTTFDFPQKFANHLIGKGGSHIKELRDRFDVDINVQDGKVELKGPKAKADAAKSHILAWQKNLADETTHTMKIEPKFHRELIGAQGTQINRLQTRYKVLIFFPRTSPKNGGDDQPNADATSEAGKPRRQQAPDEVVVRGPKKGADEARDEILSLYQYLRDTSFTDSVTMQQKHVPTLIGQGGAALEELRQATGARIDVPGSRDSETVEITLKGTKSQVTAAKKAIEAKRAVFADTVVREVEVDKKHHKALIGPNGSTLRDIVVQAGGSDERRALSRTIQFPRQDADGCTIKVEGRTDVVDKIVKRIQDMVLERDSQVTEVVDVPTDKHRTLIGRGGEAKRQLEGQFTVSIDIPRAGDGKTGVRITGRPENVEKAKAHIGALVKEQQGETMQVPRRMHHAISNNGQFFRRLRNDHHVSVDHAGHKVPPKPDQSTRANGSLPLITDDVAATANAHSWKVVDKASSEEEGDIPWVLRGSQENIERAKKMITTAMEQADRQSSTGYLTLADPKTYRLVIGPGGSKVNSIRKQSGCRINVPNQNKDEPIEVVGTREGVEKAKDMILEAVKEGPGRP